MNKAPWIALIVMGVLSAGTIGLERYQSVSVQEQLEQPQAAQIEYKAYKRENIEDLAPEESKGSTDDLTHGLNSLARDGWRLVAIEPFHATARGRVTTYYPTTYIFAR